MKRNEVELLLFEDEDAILIRRDDDGRILVTGATIAPASSNSFWLVPKPKATTLKHE